MSGEIYKVIYCSRSLIRGDRRERDAEISQILTVARANNRRHGITGALLYNYGYFAQAIEGPVDAVMNALERIQKDPRHRDVSVVECAFGDQRDFPDWSMARAQSESEEGYPGAAATLEMALLEPSSANDKSREGLRPKIMELLHALVIDEGLQLPPPV